MTPFLQTLGLLAQGIPGVQSGPQRPAPLQNWLVPQIDPGGLLAPSTQTRTPVAHEVMPALQTFGLLLHACPAVHAPQVPAPLQTKLGPQPVPGGLLAPSTQTGDPVVQIVVPFLQRFGLPLHAWPAAHAPQVPAPLQTWFVPQLVPAAFAAPLMHVALPVAHDATPS
jgi:hypothetical protein